VSAPQPVAPRYELTQLGNAERLRDAHSGDLRYVSAWNAWLCWDGVRWVRGDRTSGLQAARDVVYGLHGEIAELAKLSAGGDETVGHRQHELSKWAKRSACAHEIEGVERLARTLAPMATSPGEFDRDPWLLNVQNGTIDLRTGELREHRREDMITQLAPVAYDPDAKCPTWDAFLEEILPDAELRSWMQRLLGYTLTGRATEHGLFYCLGNGANGKSTLLNTFKAILGDYAAQASPELLLAAPRGGDDTGRRQRAGLVGKRFVLCQEVEANRFMNEAQVKQLTGGDTITAARLYENEFEFQPTHKLIVAANHLPRVRGTDDGIWRRMHTVPFDVTIPPPKRDPDLSAKLLSEAPGILAWAVRGCLEWQARGLGSCSAIDRATSEYRTDEDALAEFLAANVMADPSGFVATADLAKRHRQWCDVHGGTPWTESKLARTMKEREYRSGKIRRDGKQLRGSHGARLRDACDGSIPPIAEVPIGNGSEEVSALTHQPVPSVSGSR
jgi:putative DNA primase/helicase